RHLRPKPRQINAHNPGGSVQLCFNRNFGLSNKIVIFLPELRLKHFTLAVIVKRRTLTEI
ncbi:hypothetical protein, partial [Rhodonellum sp.]|uniref:hypothetical protein n=1 Tax=Rhodonellum sp. TaxID=2231180 RepID=UPI00271C52E0